MKHQVCQGWVIHHRLKPVKHRFRYRMAMLYLDLDTLDTAFRGRWLWSVNRSNLGSVQRRDHLRGGAPDLGQAVRDLVQAQTGQRPAGPVGLLTQPRVLGYLMNPISLYLCWDGAGQRIETVVAEVHNTPWNEQIPYVLPVSDRDRCVQAEFHKAMHVSPFLPMDMRYRLRLRHGPDRLDLAIDNWRGGERIHAAAMNLRLRPLDGPALAAMLGRTPLMSIKVAAAIYFEALRLKLKGLRSFPHPAAAPVDPVTRS